MTTGTWHSVLCLLKLSRSLKASPATFQVLFIVLHFLFMPDALMFLFSSVLILPVLSFGSFVIRSSTLYSSSFESSVESSPIGWSLSVLSFGSLAIGSSRLDGSLLGFSIVLWTGWSSPILSFRSSTTIGLSRLDFCRLDSSSLGSSVESSVLSCPSQRSGMTKL